MHTDLWVWGKELVLTEAGSPYTIKILRPKNGIKGCLSLQSHRKKTEHWFVVEGIGIAQFIVNFRLFTVKVKPGMGFYINPGCIHRLAGVENLAVLEMSTLDHHSINKAKKKDVIRYHCFQGRECVRVKDTRLQEAIDYSVRVMIKALTDRDFSEEKNELKRLKTQGVYLGKLF